MILLNYAHPLLPEALEIVSEMLNEPVSKVVNVAVQIDQSAPLDPQIQPLLKAMTDNFSIASNENETLVINPPSLSIVATMLMVDGLAEIQNEMYKTHVHEDAMQDLSDAGYFPLRVYVKFLRMVPVRDGVVTTYKPLELL